MRKILLGSMVLLPVLAANAQEAAADWHARTLGEAVWHGYKLFDLATPGKLHHEILQNKNVAAAIIGAAVILGVCVLVAAAMLG